MKNLKLTNKKTKLKVSIYIKNGKPIKSRKSAVKSH